MSSNIKFSKTSKIFDDNNFSKLLPVISKTEFLRRLSGDTVEESQAEPDSFIGKRLGKMSRRIYGNSQSDQIELQRLSELIQSISIQGLYTNQIVNEIINVHNIGKSVKITYMQPETLDALYNTQGDKKFINGNQASNILNTIGIIDSFSSDSSVVKDNIEEKDEGGNRKAKTDALNKVDKLDSGEFCHTKGNPGLSTIQVLDPNLRACFNQSQEIDAFFNLISTLDITMAMPYVKADFIIPNRIFKETGVVGANSNPMENTQNVTKNFITTSLNNFLFGSKYASNDNNFTPIARAINGNYNIDYSPVVTSGQTKKIYERQHMNSAIFLAPQTMVNADIDDALGNDVGDRKEGALIDKFRPFMTIMDLSFDVRPQKGFLFYKTATLNLMLYDKARMTEIAPFIKPELLNSHSSEITLEYGWQHNLGDDDIVAQNDITNRNPIAQFINSLKVVEKYVIVNSSYTINENGSVNISLSLAMKGPVQLRNTPMPADNDLDKLETEINTLNDFLLNQSLRSNLGQTNVPAFDVYDKKRNKMTSSNISITDLTDLKTQLKAERDRTDASYNIDTAITQHFNNVDQTIDDVIDKMNQKQQKDTAFLTSNFDFLKRNAKNNKRIHDSFTAKKNDPYIDQTWWQKNLVDKGWDDKTPGKWISLGKIITNVTGKMLCQTKKYNEIQLVFYNLNGKAIRASYLNIASIPVELDEFEKYLGSIVKDIRKMSVETFLSAVLNRCVNQKAAAVYGLDKFFKFDNEGQTKYNLDEKKEKQAEVVKQNEIKRLDASVKAEIISQYYDNYFEEKNKERPVEGASQTTQQSYLDRSSIDITFKVPRVVMNFDSMQHETDPESSILRISFYDELDNPYESLTDVMSSVQSRKLSNALSSINVYRTTKQSQDGTQTEEIITKEANEIIHELIKNKIITLYNLSGEEFPPNTIINNQNVDKIGQIKVNTSGETDLKTFINIKQMFKSYMPSLTLGQTNSALLSGNITTNQDAKYATALLMKQDGSVINNQIDNNTTNQEQTPTVEVLSDLDSSPLFVLPSQASISIIGCPLVNFAQLIFLDFNTNTTIDNIYFVSGIKHNISPGKFSTELTMAQNDLFTRYEAQSTTIKNFLTTLKDLKTEITTPEPLPDSVQQTARKVKKETTISGLDKKILISYYIKFNNSISENQRNLPKMISGGQNIVNGFNLLINNKIPDTVIQQFEYTGPQFWSYGQNKRGKDDTPDILLTKLQYLNHDLSITDQSIISNTDTLLNNFFEMIKIIDTNMHLSDYLDSSDFIISKVTIVTGGGYRSPTVNSQAGGVSKSKHLTGRAIDFKITLLDITTNVEQDFETVLLSKLILEKCFNLKSDSIIDSITQDFKDAFTKNPKSSSISDIFDNAATRTVMVGGLGLYPNKPFIHYDIRDADDMARTTAIVWYDDSNADPKNTEAKEDETP